MVAISLKALRTILPAYLAYCAVLTAAAGYDEGANSGLLNPEYFAEVHYSSGFLRLDGFVFGEQGASPFSGWAARLGCRTRPGQTTFDLGEACAIYGIQNGTLIAANGVITGQGTNLANQVVFKTNRQIANTFDAGDSGQGPSCTSGPVQNGPCSVSPSNKVPTELVYDIPNRLMKITCKKACAGAGGGIQLAPGLALLEQLGREFINNNWWAARFSIRRVQTGSDIVLARCRITIPTLAQYPADDCPDWVPGYGATIQSIETQYPVAR